MASSGSGSNMHPFNGVKVFSATMAQDRDHLGDKITTWLAANPATEVVDKIVTQSSDEAFHCLAITLFFNTPAKSTYPAVRFKNTAARVLPADRS